MRYLAPQRGGLGRRSNETDKSNAPMATVGGVELGDQIQAIVFAQMNKHRAPGE